MNIYQIQPYDFSEKKNYGKAANELIAQLPEDAWIIVNDIDGFIITPAQHYGGIVNQAIADHPDTGLFTCWSQRTRNPQQSLNGMVDEDGDLRKHRKSAVSQLSWAGSYTELDEVISGFWMLFSKATWQQVGGFYEGKKPGVANCLQVDNFFSSAILKQGLKIRRIDALVYCHYYRLSETILNTKHLM